MGQQNGAGVFRRDGVTWLAYGMLGFYNFLLSGLGPLMPSLRAELDISYGLASLHFSAFAVGMILAGLVGDRIVARFGRTATFWTGAAGLAIGAIALTIVHHPILTIGSIFVMGSVGSLVVVLIPAILADRHGSRRVTALVEANILAAATGALSGVLIGAGERTAFGWRGAYLLSLLMPLALLLLYRNETLPATSRVRGGLAGRRVRLPRAYWAFWAAVVLSVCVEFSLIFWGADFLVAAGLATTTAATTVSLFLWGMVVGRIVGRGLGERIPPERLVIVALTVAAAGFLVYWLAPSAMTTVVGLFVAGLGVANLFPLIASLAMGVAPSGSNEAAARISFASGSAILLAPLLLGALADAVGIRLAYSVVPLFICGAFAAVMAGRYLSGTATDR
ncbi:MAG: MFS transporter [Thermomicrobiales bacterium]